MNSLLRTLNGNAVISTFFIYPPQGYLFYPRSAPLNALEHSLRSWASNLFILKIYNLFFVPLRSVENNMADEAFSNLPLDHTENFWADFLTRVSFIFCLLLTIPNFMPTEDLSFPFSMVVNKIS